MYIAKTNSTRYLWGRSTWLKGRLRRRIRHSEIVRWRETCALLKTWDRELSGSYLAYFGRIAYRTHYVRYWKDDIDITTMLPEEEAGPYCKHCGDELDWERCDYCGGEGYFDGEQLQELDPLWYSEDDTERCEQCQGKGGWHFCTNRQCPGKQDET